MALRHVGRCIRYFSLVVVAGWFVTGCVIKEPPAITQIGVARKALDESVKTGRADCEHVKYEILERNYLQARGVYYACNDAEAIKLAQAVAAGANALACAPAARAVTCPPPVARFTPLPRVEAGAAVQFDASTSSTQSGQATYTWDFGDGTPPVTGPSPRTTHTYAKPGNVTVKLTVDDKNCGTHSATGSHAVILRVVMQEKGKVLFDFNKADLKPEATRQLEVVVQALREQPTLQTHITGHTDGIGSDAYNMKLSQRRAESVANYLVKSGASRQNIKTDWRGKREPIAPNDTDAGRAQNRRVEIVLSPPGS
jgi:outer membrane protein OmpA-like peptidoglycan-associated protein